MAGALNDKNGRKLNMELNLVPFIDLLSSLVLFLLVTAVWSQAGTIMVAADAKGTAARANTRQATLFVRLTAEGYLLRLENAGLVKIPKLVMKVNGDFAADRLIADLKQSFGSQVPGRVTVSSEDEVAYKNVIHAVDAMKKVGVPFVALGTD